MYVVMYAKVLLFTQYEFCMSLIYINAQKLKTEAQSTGIRGIIRVMWTKPCKALNPSASDNSTRCQEEATCADCAVKQVASAEHEYHTKFLCHSLSPQIVPTACFMRSWLVGVQRCLSSFRVVRLPKVYRM